MADNTALKPVILASALPVFAVLDGAQFDDLPSALFEGDFTHRPLYLDRGNGTADQLRTAPQLVWLDRDRKAHRRDEDQNDTAPLAPVLERLLDLVEQRPAIVFWVCEAGGEALYRHLRGINKILLPTDAAMDRGQSYERNPLSLEDDARDSDYEMVLFRHCDANVMAQVLPALAHASMARVLGPASQILCSPDTDWAERPLRLMHAGDMPPPAGPLKLSLEEVKGIEEKRRLAARRRRITYLQETCPAETHGASRQALEEHIRISEETGKRLGLVSEGAHCRWAFMMCKTNGRIAQSADAHQFIGGQGKSPDEQIKLFMRGIIEAMAGQTGKQETL
ncbi:DUF4123 domain-containing protein [Rhizobium sp. FKY42]|uniref:DUF4123 domain-containing protein n=1 Tax=Rhizobium sp. FKY42 TaxID=2562310 RepID=UPI0010BF9894|nr:DUF4123 domain-containing protein [Rhizobium sp. FKY42]